MIKPSIVRKLSRDTLCPSIRKSPDFLAGLRERYDANARERQRQIKRIEVKQNFHKEENEKAKELVDERLKSYPSTTQMEEIIRRSEQSGGHLTSRQITRCPFPRRSPRTARSTRGRC